MFKELMKYGLWLMHVYPCQGIQGTEQFYRKMASYGWILDKCCYFGDHYIKSTSKNIYYHVVPKDYVEIENKLDRNEQWIYIGNNRSFDVYYAEKTLPQHKMYTKEDIKFNGLIMQLAALFAYPICFYYLGNSFIHTFKNIFLYSVFGIYLGFAWSNIMEWYDIYMFKSREVMELKSCTFSLISSMITIVSNISQIILFIVFIIEIFH